MLLVAFRFSHFAGFGFGFGASALALALALVLVLTFNYLWIVVRREYRRSRFRWSVVFWVLEFTVSCVPCLVFGPLIEF